MNTDTTTSGTTTISFTAKSARSGVRPAQVTRVKVINPLQMLLKGRADAADRLSVYKLTEMGIEILDVLTFVDSVPLFKNKDVLAKIIGMSPRTLHRRIKHPEGPLNPEQSARALRFAEGLSRAQSLFGDRAEAERWMSEPALGLEGRTPLDLLSNPIGYELVADFLGRMENGVYQ